MVFNSLQFIPFLLLVLFFHRVLSWKYDKLFLLLASYLFYASFNPIFAILLFVSSVFDYSAARLIDRAKSQFGRRFYLFLSCCVNLGILGYFKYANFLLEALTPLLNIFGITLITPHFDIVLPIGISFYTFQTLSYTMDVYRNKVKPAGFIDFCLFVSFFTQLVAGPIVRAIDFLPQLKRKRLVSSRIVLVGSFLVLLGYFKKIVIADNLARFVGNVFDNPIVFSVSDLSLAVYGFAIQIYCDFSGYSDIAIGFSLIMGFRLKRNFRLPYLANGFSDFWRRWHISLSSWIRDYIYIPLGGNRCGRLRHILNLLFTMTLCGLWHGASWMFVLWGFYHGVLLVLEQQAKKILNQLEQKGFSWVGHIRRSWVYQAFCIAGTFFAVCIGWVFFRSASFSEAKLFIHALFQLPAGHMTHHILAYVVLFYGFHVGVFLKKNGLPLLGIRPQNTLALPWALYPVVAAGMAFYILTAWESTNVFIYFQF